MILFNDKDNPWGRKPGPRSENQDKNGQKTPWGSNGGGSAGNGVDEAIEMMQNRFKKRFGGGNGGDGKDADFGGGFSPRAFIIGMIAVLAFWLASGFFRVQEGELGVVLRFGEMVRMVSPGLQYHVPAPFEQVIIRNVAAVNKIDGGVKGNNDATDQTLILTGDENMVHTNYTVLWVIKDIKEFLFNALKPEVTIDNAAKSVIREIFGQTQARLALTEGRDKIGVQAQEHLQKMLDEYKLGVQIVSVQLQSVAPPQEVVGFFNDVQASKIDADRERNAAEAYRNDKLPRAGGQAKQIIAEAEAYRGSKIPEAEGEALRFNQILSSLKGANRDIIMKRYYFETMQNVLSKTQKIILDPKSGQGVLPYLPLPNMKKAPTPAAEGHP